MNILVLHNNNIPVFLRASFQDEDLNVISDTLFPYNDNNVYDTFVSNELKERIGLLNSQVDLVVLPYTLNHDNYMEFTGLRVATHIRLTPEWGISSVPILFIGPESDHLIDVMKYSDLGDLLNSYNIFKTSKIKRDEIINMFRWIEANVDKTDSEQDKHKLDLLKRLKKISAPANYLSRHSIANEWAISRWMNMFNWPKGKRPQFANTDFSNMLYFKYLVAESEVKMLRWGKKEKKNLGEDGFQGKRIVYIDDEADKGWGVLLGTIFEKSGAEFVTYSFKDARKQKKEELIQNIKDFVSTDQGADCYLLDLRLHEDDFIEGVDYKQLSGHQIATYIKGLNLGNQIVIFSASNKIWNIEEAQEKYNASSYVIKESPEQHFTNDNTYILYCDFIKKIRHACELSYLKDIYSSLALFDGLGDEVESELSLLYSYPELVALDNNKKNDPIIKSCVFTLITFIESFVKKRFSWSSDTVYRNDSTWSSKFSRRIWFKEEENSKIYYCYDDKSDSFSQLHPGQIEIEYREHADLPLVLLALYLYYKNNEKQINFVGSLKDIRNKYAHQNVNLTDKEKSLIMKALYDYFFKVILPMLKVEYNIN